GVVLEAVGAIWAEPLRAHIAALEKERDAAVADNAALVHGLRALLGGLRDAERRGPVEALLEEHGKALVRARNEGLEEAARVADARKASHAHNRTPCGPCMEDFILAGIIRAMKDPVSEG